jgi:hypothetical protein
MQEWLNRAGVGGVGGRIRPAPLRMSPSPHLALWLVSWLDSTDALQNINWNNMSVNNEYPIKECLSTQAIIHVDSVSMRWKNAEEGFTADVLEILVVYVFRLSYT